LPLKKGYCRCCWLQAALQAAMSTRPVSENWLTGAFRGLDATLKRLRADRRLDEALTCSPDPLWTSARPLLSPGRAPQSSQRSRAE
jgi:hypothetical protein